MKEHLAPRRTHRSFRICALLSAALTSWLACPIVAKADPGAEFERQRAALVAKFDKNGDGRLDAAERETARSAKKTESQRPRRNQMFQMPPEIVAKYDKDGDGQLNDEENAAAGEGIRARWAEAQKEFDANGDGNLDDAERDKMGEAIAAGKVEGLPRMFGGMMRGGGRGGRGGRGGGGMFGGGGAGESPLAQFDTNKDGRLDNSELDAARKAGAGKPAGQ